MTIEIWILAAIVFLPVAVISFVALRRAWEPQEAAQEPASRPGMELVSEDAPELLFEKLTYPFAAAIPITKNGRMTLFQELRSAGYYQNSALTNFLALRNLMVLAALLITGLLTLAMDDEDIPVIALAGGVTAILAFSIPRLYIQGLGRKRARQIERGLPTAVDLLTLALTAGLNLFAAFKRVATELRFSYPVLAQEFEITSRQAELRSLEHALGQLADRVRLPDVRNLAIILAQSERLGSDATAILLETSNSLRTSLRQRAETQANRVSFWLLFPTIGCFLVGAGILIIGPVLLDVNSKMNENRGLLLNSRKDIDKIIQFNKKKPMQQIPAQQTPP